MNDMTSARLDLVAAKAKVLAEEYKSGKLWEGDLGRMLDELLRDITAARNSGGIHERGRWGDR